MISEIIKTDINHKHHEPLIQKFIFVRACLTTVSGQINSCWFVVKILLVFFLLASCSSPKLPVQVLVIERDGAEIAAVNAEIARTQEERGKGLMFRKKLPDGEGMLFVYERDEVMSFWMKNTRVPLTIAFIASDGRIVDMKDMYPHDENPVRSSRSVRYALEVPQGWFSRAGVQSADVVKIPQ